MQVSTCASPQRVRIDRASDRLLLAQVSRCPPPPAPSPSSRRPPETSWSVAAIVASTAGMAIRHVQDEWTEHDARGRDRERAQDRPTLEDERCVVHAPVEVVIGPDAGEARVDRDGRRVAHVSPTRAEGVEEEVDLNGPSGSVRLRTRDDAALASNAGPRLGRGTSRTIPRHFAPLRIVCAALRNRNHLGIARHTLRWRDVARSGAVTPPLSAGFRRESKAVVARPRLADRALGSTTGHRLCVARADRLGRCCVRLCCWMTGVRFAWFTCVSGGRGGGSG